MNFRFTKSFIDPPGSPIRELFPYLSWPGMISFAGGYPSPSLFDTVGLAEAGHRALANAASCLQYGATEGIPLLREALALLGHSRGICRNASDILVTTGSQQGFDLLTRIFVTPGDVVYVETPAYPAAIQALRLAGARIREIPVDAHGLEVDRLEASLQDSLPTECPKFLYTVPNFSNPCGTLLAPERREKLVQLAIQYNLLLIEDDPYGELNFSVERPVSLFQTGDRLAGADNPVVYLSSLSKTVAPALRIGWMVAPAEILRRCAIAKQTVDLCTSPLVQMVAVEYLASNRYFGAVGRACTEYALRMRTMVDALNTELPGKVRFVGPEGGMFIWVESVDAIDPKALFHTAVDHGVLYVPGSAFYPVEPNPNTMRLSYAAPSAEEISQGVARLGKAWRSLAS